MMISDELIPSPCIRNCCLDEADICLGCFRSLAEVVGWSDADTATRQQILLNVKNRQEAYQERYKQESG